MNVFSIDDNADVSVMKAYLFAFVILLLIAGKWVAVSSLFLQVHFIPIYFKEFPLETL